MAEKVLGLEVRDFEEAFKYLKKEEFNTKDKAIVSRKETIIAIRKMLEVMVKEQVPVVSVELLENEINKIPHTLFVGKYYVAKDIEKILNDLLSAVRLQAGAKRNDR